MSDRPTYRLEVTALPGWPGTTMSRLRMALKALARAYGIKVTDIAEVKPGDEKPTGQTTCDVDGREVNLE